MHHTVQETEEGRRFYIYSRRFPCNPASLRSRGGGEDEALAAAASQHIEEHIIAVAPEQLHDDLHAPATLNDPGSAASAVTVSSSTASTPQRTLSSPTDATIPRAVRIRMNKDRVPSAYPRFGYR
jgi:hypothetical protein